MPNIRPIFFDTETTGTKFDKDKIIEIAAYDPISNKSFCELINPNIPIPPDATAIHNITDEMVQDKESFANVAKRFLEFMHGDIILIAHNLDAFDLPFLKTEFGKCNLPLPQNWQYIDSLKWARKYRPDLPRHSLQYLREAFQIPANKAHRALNDVIILMQVFTKMIDDLSYATILELLNENKTKISEIEVMPFGKHAGKPLESVPKNYILWLLKEGVFDKEENASLKKSLQKIGYLEGKSMSTTLPKGKGL